MAATPDEQGQAHEAWRLADHELDLTFAAALREAEAEAAAALPASGPLRQLSDSIARLKARVEADKKRVEELGKDGGDALDLAQAQLDLDQDELDDAQQDLAREGGDKRARLQRLLQEHEASEKVADQAVKFGTPGATGTMSEQLRDWLSLGEYDRQLQAAAQQAAARARTLLDRTQHARGSTAQPARRSSLRGSLAATFRTAQNAHRPRPARRGHRDNWLPSMGAGARWSKIGGARCCI